MTSASFNSRDIQLLAIRLCLSWNVPQLWISHGRKYPNHKYSHWKGAGEHRNNILGTTLLLHCCSFLIWTFVLRKMGRFCVGIPISTLCSLKTRLESRLCVVGSREGSTLWSGPHGISRASVRRWKYNKKLISIQSKICQTILDRRPIAVS